ncbi:uncharacterized protein LOC113508482 [Trichoplusia ni]|uniref:Uncharacterized protein LOC113508482 n=1 Tax=Trichoplusia ni TaxID=7111 RepID=A0A7E5X4K4_TRINI|nr:uncharacterized protein LOC113508482 [Trichoplusia ni]
MEKQVIITVLLLSVCAWQAHAVVNCTATGAGRFADPADATCQNYTLCIFNAATATYVSYNYVCPTTSLFSPTLSQCTSTYTCPNTTNVAPTVPAATCTADGFVADPASTDCSTYIQCVLINGVYSQTQLTCPTGTFYNPTTTLCDPNYVCGFTCTTAGRFPNTADTTCQSYYYCVLLATGLFTQVNYTCPTTSVFSPLTSVCTTTYTCPTAAAPIG